MSKIGNFLCILRIQRMHKTFGGIDYLFVGRLIFTINIIQNPLCIIFGSKKQGVSKRRIQNPYAI